MNEDLYRQRMMRGSLGVLERPTREIVEIPSAGLDFFKVKTEDQDMAQKGTCGKCQKIDTQLIGKGLCWKCRNEAIKAGTYNSDRKEQSPPPPMEIAAPTIEKPAEAETQSVEKPGGIDALLKSKGPSLEIPAALMDRMEQAEVYLSDVIVLIELLLDGQLRYAE